MTKVLMISTDRKILEKGSSARIRMEEYAALFDELHIVVLGGKKSESMRLCETGNPDGGLFVYSMTRINALFWKPPQTDIVTSQDPFETGSIAKRIAKKIGAPLHLQIHTDFMNAHFKRSPLNMLRVALSRRNLREAKAIRVVSERIKRTLSPGEIGNARVLPIFADVESIRRAPVSVGFRQERFKFEKVVLMASRLTKEKDIVTALEAFSVLSKSHSDSGLVIVGEGPEERNLRSQVQRLKLEDKVVFEPWADRETLSSYMKTADVFLSTSLFEGYGLSMLEAHAAGCALVATDAGIAPELTSFICEPQDTACIAQRLEEALSDQKGNKAYEYPYSSKQAYLDAFKADLERCLQ